MNTKKSRETVLFFRTATTNFLVNLSEQTGYYRVNYDEEAWAQIGRAYPTLSTITRSQLLDDALNLARAGRLAYDTALVLTRQLANETALVPLGAAKTAFRFLERMLRQEDGYAHLQGYLIKLLKKVYKQVCWPRKTDENPYLFYCIQFSKFCTT